MSLQVNRVSESQHSRSVSQFASFIDDLSDEDLLKRVRELKQQVRLINLENEILERTLLRLDPTWHGLKQAMAIATRRQSTTSLRNPSSVSKYGLGVLDSPYRLASITSKLLTSASRASTRRVADSVTNRSNVAITVLSRVNIYERAELVTVEMDRIEDSLKKARSRAAKEHALLKAQLEEITDKAAEIAKFSQEFHIEVVVNGWDRISQRIPAEVWIKFMNETLKMSDRQVGKLRLRTSTLNTQYSKLRGQIKIKAELNEDLRPVDFEKLVIENDVCHRVIDSKLIQLSELKKMTGTANLTLVVHKRLLLEQNLYLKRVLKSIEDKKRVTKALDHEKQVIKSEVDSLATKFEEVKAVRQAYEVPDVMDYVQVKSDFNDVQHTVKYLENRLRVLTIDLKSLNRKLHSVYSMYSGHKV